jgi:hypothetical protein
MMVAGLAAPVDRLAPGIVEDVDLSPERQGLEGAIDGREAHALSAAAKPVVEVLGAAEAVLLGQSLEDGGALTG